MADFAPVDINSIQLDQTGGGSSSKGYAPVDIKSIKLDKPSGNDGGEGVAFGEGLANSVPGGQKISSAIGATIAKAASPITGEERTFGQLYNQANADTAATAMANPKSALAGSATGVISSLPLYGAAGKAIGAGAGAVLGEKTVGALSGLGTASDDAGLLSKTANLGVHAAKGAAGAAPVGALYGAANEDWGKGAGAVANAAEEGGATAAKIGAGIAVGAPILGAAAGAVADIAGPASRAVVSKVAPAYAAQAEQDVAMGKIIKRINADFPDPVERQAALEKAINTPGVGLGEALGGKNTTNLATGAAQYPEGKAAAQSYIDTRASGSPGRIAKTFADQVSSNSDYFGTVEGITQKGRQAAKSLYDTAYDANKAISSPEIHEVLQTPAGKQALAAARVKMLNDRSVMTGLSDQQVGEQARQAQLMQKLYNAPESQYVKPDMNVTEPTPQLNLRSLDYVKRALDDQIGKAYGTPGEADDARILTGLKNDLIKGLDTADQTGAYAKARSTSGDYLRNSKAMDDGRDFMKPGTAGQPEQIAAKFKALGPTEQESYKAGMVRAVKEAMDKPSADQPNYYTKVFGSADMQNRLKAVLNPSEFDVLSKNMQAEQNLYKFKYDVLGNSRTAEKQISAQEFENGGSELYKDVVTHGEVKKPLIKAGAKWIGSMFDGMSNKTAGQVSKILYETDPAKKLQILNAIKSDNSVGADEKQEAIKAYFSVNGLFKNLAKIQGTVNNGDENGQ